MSAFDLASLLWPDVSQRRQPQHAVRLRDGYAGGVAYIGAHRIDTPQSLPQVTVLNPGVDNGERCVNAEPITNNDIELGPAGVSHIIVVRIRPISYGSYWYYLHAGGFACAFSPYHSSVGNRCHIYDGTTRDSNVVLPTDRFSTVVVRFLPGETAFFIDGVKTSSAGRTVSNNTWYYGAQAITGTQPVQSLLAWIPGDFSDSECARISDEPYSALFQPRAQIGFEFPAAGPITLNSLTISNITSSGARATLSITR